MNVFISWSGEKSKKVAEAMKEWLPSILQYVDPWFSPEDISAGSIWDAEIQGTLEKTNIGIICLTHENKDQPWILFEAGALSKGLSLSRVMTFLVDLKPQDLLNNPLSKFNHTFNTKESLLKMVRSINENADGEKIKDDLVKKSFEKFFPDLEENIKKTLSEHSTTKPKKPSQDEILSEILETVRNIDRNNRPDPKLSNPWLLEDVVAEDEPVRYIKYLRPSNFFTKQINTLTKEEIDRLYDLVKLKPDDKKSDPPKTKKKD